MQSKLQRLHKALYDAEVHAVESPAQALSMLNRVRQDIGIPLLGSTTSAMLDQSCDEAIEMVGC